MKRNTNVFKLSGNLALGGGNDYMGNENLGKGNSYGVSSSNALKRTSNYGQSYENNQEYDYSQKAGTSQARKFSRNQQENGYGNYKQGTGYENTSSKKIDYNYQNALNKLETDQLYNNKGGYANSYRDSSMSKGSYKDVYSNNQGNYPSKSNINNRDSTKGSYRNYEEQTYTNSKQSYGNRVAQQETQDYYNQPTRGTNKPPTNTKPYNGYTQSKLPSYEQQSYNNNTYKDQSYKSADKEQIKEYDPSTFVMCRQGCGRKFNPDSISKHQKVCKKVFQNKRPEFNVQEQRIVAKEQKKLMKQGEIIEKKLEQKKKVEQKKQQNIPKWKAESLGFRAAMKANRRGGEMTQEEKKLISQAQDSSMVNCRFCGRNFSEKAAQRHIPFCETQQKKNALKKKK